jgi:hypothetical protein
VEREAGLESYQKADQTHVGTNGIRCAEKESVYMSSLGNAPDVTEKEREIVRKVQPFAMTTPQRILSLIRSVEYVVRNGIE